jgi:hypothetical protein
MKMGAVWKMLSEQMKDPSEIATISVTGTFTEYCCLILHPADAALIRGLRL